MKCFLKAAASLTLLLGATGAGALDLINPAYIYAEARRQGVNWLYIGFAPRMQDNRRVKVILSKAGYTMRVKMDMTPDDVIDYPRYILRRFDQVKTISDGQRLSFPQQHRFAEYERQVDEIRRELAAVRADMQSQYAYGMTLLRRFYPLNVFEIVQNGNVARVEGHFVYPITIHRSITWPRPGIYRPYIVEERRSYYSKDQGSHIFGGFPAFWLDPAGAGTGVHGPIRYSDAGDRRRDGGTGRMRDFWAENNFLNEPVDPVHNLEPTYRWDLVRTHQSHGCFRAEPLELRHLLPSDPWAILDDNKVKLNLGKGPGRSTRDIDYDSVEFEIISEYDVLSIEGHIQNRIVNVDYYVTDPYQKPDKNRWLRQYLLSGKEREGRGWEETLMTKMTNDIATFPYLDPAALEFVTPQGGPANSIMSELNQTR